MKRKDFWKGFGAALALVLAVSIAWKPLCGIIPWNELPFEVNLSRNTKLNIIQSYLDRYYVEDFDREQIEDMLCAGMMAGVGDKYTYYLTAESMEEYMENTNGNFGGVGLEVRTNQAGEVEIQKVMEGQPAEEAGLMARDIIVSVDGEDMRGRVVSDVAAKMRGEEGTEVTLGVLRKSTGETLEFTMQRKIVEVESVSVYMLEDGIGYLMLEGFKRNTYDQYKAALEKLEAEGMRGLILDLRNNPGGLLDSVHEIGEELLPEGTMVYTLDKNGNRDDLKCDGEYLDIPLVLLVNGYSASASEILAGAVKDTGRGTLVGTQTFGKGLVQRSFPLPDGSGLSITIRKYYTPNGISIHGVGITPDVVVELPEEYREMYQWEIPEGEDTQLEKAAEILRGEIG